jgi:hypothetical protein
MSEWLALACDAGHVHAYERMWPVFNYKLDPCAPVSITIGEPAFLPPPLLSLCLDAITHSIGTWQALQTVGDY